MLSEDGGHELRRSNSIRSGGGGVRGIARQAASALRKDAGFDPEFARKVRAEDEGPTKNAIEADCQVEEVA
jgi:hypothetical protein